LRIFETEHGDVVMDERKRNAGNQALARAGLKSQSAPVYTQRMRLITKRTLR